MFNTGSGTIRNRKLAIAVALNSMTFVTMRCYAADPPTPIPQAQPADLPAQIAELKARIQGKESAEMLAIIQAQFGSPARSIGSGLYIPQWDVTGGVLTFHPWRGPSFSYGTSKVMLIDTQNKVGHNIPGNYQMSTLLDKNRTRFMISTSFMIGEVILQVGGRYRFKRVEASLADYTKDVSNFFTAHPNGTYTVLYAKTVQESSVMENLPDNTVIATLEFAADPADKLAGDSHTLDLRIDVPGRTLYFAPHIEPPLTYQLEKSWEEFWN